MSELSRETDALLRQGRDGESLSPGDRTRLKRAVLAQAAAVSVVATTSSAAAWTTVAAKVIGVVVVVGSVAGAAVVLPTWTGSAAKNAPTKSSVTTAAPVRTERASPTKIAAAPAIPSAPVAPPLPSAPPAVAPAVQAPIATVTHASSPPSVPASSLEEEARLLGAADDAMKAGDAATALRILADHSARFPSSALAPERAAERISALCMAGRRDEARQEAERFLREQSVGPLAARVRASCGE